MWDADVGQTDVLSTSAGVGAVLCGGVVILDEPSLVLASRLIVAVAARWDRGESSGVHEMRWSPCVTMLVECSRGVWKVWVAWVERTTSAKLFPGVMMLLGGFVCVFVGVAVNGM